MSKIDGIYLGFSNNFFRFQEVYRETLQLLIREYIIRFKSMECFLEKEVCVVSKGRPYYIQLLRFEYDDKKGNYRIILHDDFYPLDLEEMDYPINSFVNELYEKIKKYDNETTKDNLEG